MLLRKKEVSLGGGGGWGRGSLNDICSLPHFKAQEKVKGKYGIFFSDHEVSELSISGFAQTLIGNYVNDKSKRVSHTLAGQAGRWLQFRSTC